METQIIRIFNFREVEIFFSFFSYLLYNTSYPPFLELSIFKSFLRVFLGIMLSFFNLSLASTSIDTSYTASIFNSLNFVVRFVTWELNVNQLHYWWVNEYRMLTSLTLDLVSAIFSFTLTYSNPSTI